MWVEVQERLLSTGVTMTLGGFRTKRVIPSVGREEGSLG